MWHPLRSFLNVVSEFVSSTKEARLLIHFFGVNLNDLSLPSSIEKLVADEFPLLSTHIQVHKKMSNDLLLMELAQQNVLLLFNDYSLLGTKIFDYIGLKRNILFCYANDPESAELKRKYYLMEETEGISGQLQQELLLKTNAGYIIQDAAHLLKKLKELYEEFKRRGYIENKTIHAEDYSRLHQIKKLAEVINAL
jgi:hypothetical protein